MKISTLTELPFSDFLPLLKNSQSEGYEFVERLVNEYRSGTNKFDKAGEVLLGAYVENELVAVGGLNQDPYAQSPDTGRIRHLYVLPAYRRQGIGAALIQELIDHAKGHFQLLTLRTFNSDADIFYRQLGFQLETNTKSASHLLLLTN